MPDWIDRIFHDVNMEFDSERRGPAKSSSFKPSSGKLAVANTSHISQEIDENTVFIEYICKEHFDMLFKVTHKMLEFANKPQNANKKKKKGRKLISNCEVLIHVLLEAFKKTKHKVGTHPSTSQVFEFVRLLMIFRSFHKW